jgi:hypothetical protein
MTNTAFTGARVRMFRLAVVLTLIGVPVAAMTDRTAEANVELSSPAIELDSAAAVIASAVPVSATASTATLSAFDPAAWQDVEVGSVDARVFETALKAAANAIERGDAADPGTLTVIDFSRPSTERRMWVYDLRARTLLFDELVSHGRGSGVTMATAFSNVPESNRSSLGLYRTAETYIGKHGYSLRIDGLEPGINDRARERAIVIHAADYVNEKSARAQGYLGRSLGCPALRPEVARQVIDTVKGGGLIFAYYPDPNWLRTSKYRG